MHRMKKVLLAIRFASRLRRKRVAPKTEVEAGENQLNDNEGEENPDQVQEAETNGKVQGKRAWTLLLENYNQSFLDWIRI